MRDKEATSVATGRANELVNRSAVLSLVSSFTADPLAEPLEYLLREMGMASSVVPAPYGQVFQTLLDPSSAARSAGIVIVAIRFADFGDTMVVDELANAIRSAHDASAGTFVVCVCPSNGDAGLEEQLRGHVSALARVRFVGTDELLGGAPASAYYDEERNRLGHVPYVPLFFARLATAAARRVYGVRVPARKVIALDGDNTLWRGIVGEDGVDGVALDEGRRELQEFLLEQQRAGMLLCLVSKNNESDVHELFERRTEMPLTLEHFVATRINWERKSENLRALAAELSLGLDSFIFVDDSLVECSEVQQGCPEVLTIELPTDARALDVLRNTWAFDHWVVTKEDRQRTAMYQQSRAREEIKKSAVSLDEFIAELGVEVRVSPIIAAEMPRGSQLTHRTNQFNFTTVRRTEGELAALASGAESVVLVAQVRDRFGDYGLTGLVVAREQREVRVPRSAQDDIGYAQDDIGSAQDDKLVVDTFLLSCRVLGRGVEQRILEELARIASERGVRVIEMPFVRTKRNAPAEQFLMRFDAQYRSETADGFVVRIPASEIATINKALPSIEAPVDDGASTVAAAVVVASASNVAARLREIVADPERLLAALATARRRARPDDAPPMRGVESDTARCLLPLWSELLGVEPIGADDNFFAFGGDSLLGTLLLSRVRATLGVSLPIRALFEAPTPATLADWIATAPAHAGDDGQLAAIEPLPAGAVVPLSRGQVRLWVMERLDGATAALNVPTAFALEGEVNVEALRRALVEITRRHHVLRSRFVERDGRPYLEVGALSSSVLVERTVADDAAAMRLLNEEASRPFDVSVDSPLRAVLVHGGANRHHLIVTMHHIVSDGWSQGVLVRELSALYDAFSRDVPSPLAPLAVQYADVVAWEQKRDAVRDRSADVAFWKSALTEAPALSVPTDRARPATATQRGAHVHIAWDADTARIVRELSRRASVTPFITLLAAWAAVLQRYSGQDDLVVGSAVANRQHESAEPLIGFFVNTLALRMHVSPAQTFLDFLTHVRDVALSAQEHALPFDVVVDAVRPPVDASRHPLFQAAFVLQNWAMPPLAFPGVTATQVSVETGGSQLDLQLSLGESASGITGALEYNRDLFDANTAERLTESLGALLRSALRAPDQPLSTLSLVSDAQLEQLEAFGRAGGVRPEFLAPLFHEMFESHARATPDAIALRFQGQSLTYGELNARANRVARALQANGVGIESLVGLCVDRSFELIIGLLGTLKAGAAFVPMDPRYPRERLRLMLEDSAAAVVLVTPESRAVVDVGGVVVLDVATTASADVSTENLSLSLEPGHLAYVIFTSGSTGRPKGTLIEHRGLANFAHYFIEVCGAESAKRVLQFASPSFDASVSEYTLALGHGGTLVLPTREQIQSWPDLVQLLRTERVTNATLPPALLRASAPESFPELVTLIAAGEASSRELVDRWAVGRRMLNGYGPTEVTIAASYGLCVAGDLRAPAIGIPVPNSRSYVVDADGRLVPIGMAGELWVGGAGLARGYLNRAETTAQKFVVADFGDGEERVYRTGDLVRWREDGNLEFIGRIDDQVKIRGHRVELGEIESSLLRVAGVRDAVVIAREDEPGDRRLVAYIIGDATDDAMRSALQRELPDYMVPNAFVRMRAFPLSPNGKTDRKALPKPDTSVAARRSSYAAPRTETERVIADIWSQVLKVADVGVDDDFFSLGGDSILSIQVLSRCVKAGILLTARQLFLTPTIAELARTIQPVVSAAPRAVIEEAVPEGDVELTPIQRWFFELSLDNSAYWNQAFLFTVPANIDADRLERALVRVAERHDALRLRFRKSGGKWKQSYGAAANVTLERFDVSELQSRSLVALRMTEARIAEIGVEVQESLHLSRGPLVAAAHISLGDGESGRLLLVAHHLVVDGVSWRILMEDLEVAYAALTEQRPIGFPARSTSYQKWAVELNARGVAPVDAATLSHWRTLHGIRASAFGAGNETDNLESDALTASITLSRDETESLLRAVPQATGATAQEAMLAALGMALGERTVIDVEGHGREAMFADVDLARSVGWFTSVYPVVLPSGTSSPIDALSEVKAHLRAVPTKGADFLALKTLSTDATVRGVLDAVPQSDVVFNYLGQFDQVVAGSQLFGFANESTGAWHDPSSTRAYAHEVGAIVRGGQLELTWTYDPQGHSREVVESALARFASSLRALIGAASGESAPANRYALSPIQEGLLFHALSAPDSAAYQIQSTWTLRGPLDVAAYRGAWEALLARHSILRTEFVWEGVERPQQVVRDDAALDWRYLDACEDIVLLRETERQERFDLSRAPLMRITLVRTGADAHEVIWSFHHLLLDGWSGTVIVREVAQLYEALAAGREPQLPSVRPYGDYIAQLKTVDASAEAYWRNRLKGVTAPTSLGIDQKRVDDGATDFHETTLELTSSATSGLRALAREQRVTLNVVMQAAWSIILRCYSGEDDVVFGETVTNRPVTLEGVERMVGLFLNTLPVRVQLEPNAPVSELLRAMQREQGEKSAFESTSLTSIQHWSELPRGTGLFDSLLVFENYPSSSEEAVTSGVTVHDLHVVERTHYPLTMTIVPGDTLLIRAMYDVARFDKAAVNRTLEHLQTVLGELAADASRPVREIDLLKGSSEKQLVVEMWNNTAAEYPRGATLVSLVAEQVARTPDAVAVEDERVALTYVELDACAHALAADLVARGVTRGALVGVCADRSVELVIALLGVVKAGGAYVPIDAGYPPDRIAFMLADSDVGVLLTTRELVQNVPALAARASSIMYLDDVASSVSEPLTQLPMVRADDPAYMIYTSGSTGRPKGALNAHSGIVNRLLWMQSEYQLRANDVVLQKTPFSFDVSVWEFFWPLLTGARIVMARPEGHRDPGYLCDVIARRGVTVCHFVPSMLRAFLAEPAASTSVTLRDVMASGEALPPDVVAQFNRRLPGARLHNLYGPTECAVDVSYWPCPKDPEPLDVIPIGRPVANTQLYVLEPSGRPVPIGVPGELFLAGVQVGLGYHNRPELTAERFVRDTFSRDANARMYRTGDRARWRADGTVEYLGRIDFQVKVRGYRIELGEIEAVLSQHAGVNDVVVVVRSDRAGEQRLVAYVVVADAAMLGDLKQHVGERLPDYMVPSAFVRLDALPLSSNGKVDRKQLPEPQDERAEARPYTAPRSAAEEKLTAIWCAVLRRDVIGVHDNFFELGGDSILSIQIASRAREVGLPLTVASLRKYPTIAEQAHAASQVSQVVVAEARAKGNAPLTPIQRWFFDLDVAERDYWNQAFVFESSERLDEAAIRSALAALLEHHDALRLRFAKGGDTWTQQFAEKPDTVPLVVEDVDDASTLDGVIQRLASTAQHGLDIERGPLMSAVLVRSASASRLLIVVHHLAIDGVSWRILVEDLEQAYRSKSLPSRSASYKRWADALVSHASSQAVRDELPYWSTVSRAPLRALPRTQEENTVEQEHTITLSLTEGETADFLQRAPAAYATQVNDLLLTALGDAMQPWVGVGDVLIDLEGHGREDIGAHADFSRTVGWFTSLFPLRLPVGGATDPGVRIRSMKERLREVPHHGIGYGVLRYLAKAKELANAPNADVIFNYLGQFGGASTGLLRFGKPDAAGSWVSPRGKRPHLLAVNALVMDGKLQVNFTYGRLIHETATVQGVAESMMASLRALTAHCLTPGVGGRSPSDYPLATLTRAEVNALAGNGREIEDILAVAPLQELFLATAGTASEHGFEQQRIEITGDLDAAALGEAWQLAAARHQMLRSEFAAAIDGGPVQVVRRSTSIPFEVHDLRRAGDRETRVAELAARDRATGFTASHAPLMRVHLARTANDKWTMIWSHHHLLLDRWSIPLVLSEVGVAYDAFRKGATPPLAPAPLWRNYIEWLHAQSAHEAEEFWTKSLAGTNAASTPMLEGAGGNDGEEELILSASDTEAIAARARECRTTVNAVVSAAWALWLSRATGRNDVTFGLAVAVRPEELAGVRALVGMCINNVPARLEFSAAESVNTVIARVSERLDASNNHAHVALTDIQRWSGLPWHHRVFDSLVVFHHQDDDATVASWLGESYETAMLSGEMQTNYPLTLVAGGGSQLRLRLAWQGRTAGASGVRQVLASVAEILRGLAAPSLGAVGELLGKIPSPLVAASAAVVRDLTPTRSDTEWVVALIWAELLGLEAIGREENFFALGGQSLVATQILSRVHDSFQMTLPISLLFEHPTVAGFSAALTRREPAPGQAERIATITRRVEEMSVAELREAGVHD